MLIFLITLSIFAFVILVGEETLISVAPTLETKPTEQDISLTAIVVSDITIKVDDEIAFSTGDYTESEDKLKFKLTKEDATPLVGKVTFSKGDTYNIFYTSKDDLNTHHEQTTKQIVMNALAANTISEITTPSKIYSNVAANVKFQFADYSLKNSDKLVFSISDDSNPTSKRQETLISSLTLTDTTYSASFTFTDAGTYKLWIERGGVTLQEGKSLVVITRTNSPELITEAGPTYINDADSKVSLTVDALVGDTIGFSPNNDPPANDLQFVVVANDIVDSKVSKAVPFSTAGIYNIVYQISNGNGFVKQTKVRQRVFAAKLSASTITNAEGTDVKAEADASIKITFVKQTLYDTDKIVFAIGDTIGTDKAQMVLASVDFAKTDHTQKVKFPKEGKYNLWIQRGDTSIKQTKTGLQITVAAADPEPETPTDDDKEDDGDSSNWLSMSFMILTGLLLL